MIPTPHRRRRRPASRRALALLTAATAAGSLAAAAPAFAAPDLLVPRGSGLSAPTGVAQTPDGARWVSDGLLGVCRVKADGAGVEESLYCSDTHTGAPHAGPISPTGLAFDPATSNFYAGDIQSNFGGVWRLHWDAERGVIDGAVKLVNLGDDRVTGVALAPGGYGKPASLVYTTKRSAAVMKLDDPAVGAGAPAPAGFARQEAPNSVAVLDGDVYLADGGSVTRFSLAGGSGRAAVTVPGTDGLAATALAADAERGRVYAGTSFPELADEVAVIDKASGAVETYERGFAGVSGLGVEADGTLLVGDDPGVAAGNIDSANQGRLYGVGYHALGRGGTTITAAPAAWSAADSVTFRYSSSAAHAAFECRLDGADWAECDGYGSGSVTLEGLDEGTHAFEVRAVTPAGPGVAVRRVFVIDRTAPSVRLLAPADGAAVVRGKGRVEMVADEAFVAYTCSIDGGAPVACEPGQELPALPEGAHTLRVSAVDPAGNASAADAEKAFTRFTVLAPPVRVPTPAPVVEPAPADPTPAVPPAAPETFVPRGEVAGVSSASAPRLKSLRLRTRRLSLRSGKRTLRVEIEAGAGARLAHVVIRSARGRTVAVRDLRIRANARNRLTLTLKQSEVRPMAAGRYVVGVELEGADGTAGDAASRSLRVTAR
jgi:hypothetical protein